MSSFMSARIIFQEQMKCFNVGNDYILRLNEKFSSPY